MFDDRGNDEADEGEAPLSPQAADSAVQLSPPPSPVLGDNWDQWEAPADLGGWPAADQYAHLLREPKNCPLVYVEDTATAKQC